MLAVGQIDDELLAQISEGIRGQDQPAIGHPREAPEGRLDVGGRTNRHDERLDAERGRRSLDRAHKEFRLRRGVGVEHDPDPNKRGRHFLEQTEPFPANRELINAEAGEIATRLRNAGDETLRDWIGDLQEDDWDGVTRLSDGRRFVVDEATITSGI
jgi:hypothetical protein